VDYYSTSAASIGFQLGGQRPWWTSGRAAPSTPPTSRTRSSASSSDRRA
jgi:hypothetical protein